MQEENMDVDVTPILKPLEPLEEATVYFFTSANTNDSMSNTIPVRKDSDLPTVLKELVKRYSPIKRQYFIHYIYVSSLG